MNIKGVAAIAATGGLAIGIGGSILTYSLTDNASSAAPVIDAISSYVSALNEANVQKIGSMSCGQLEKDFKSAKPEFIATQLKAASKERGPATVDEFRNVSIEDGRAMAAAAVTYDKGGRSQANLATYGLREVDGQWKVCWTAIVTTVDASAK